MKDYSYQKHPEIQKLNDRNEWRYYYNHSEEVVIEDGEERTVYIADFVPQPFDEPFFSEHEPTVEDFADLITKN